MINLAVLVALFANLSHLGQALAEIEPGPNGKRMQANALSCDVLGKLSGVQAFNPHGRHLINTLLREQTDLAMPVARMCIPTIP